MSDASITTECEITDEDSAWLQAELEKHSIPAEELARITAAPVEWKDRSGGRDECHVAGRNGIVVGAVGRSDPDMPWDVILETSSGPRMVAPAWELDLEAAKEALVDALREQDADDVLLRGRRW